MQIHCPNQYVYIGFILPQEESHKSDFNINDIIFLAQKS